MFTLILALTSTVATTGDARTTIPQATPAGQPATFLWGDWDGDGLDDAFIVTPAGEAHLMRNRRDGSFEDVTARAGLVGLGNVTAAAWGDFDADGKLDLFVGRMNAGDKLYHNAGRGLFEPAEIALKHAGAARFAHWQDYDRDGLVDLHVHTDEGDVLYHNHGATIFERVELPQADRPAAPAITTRAEMKDGALAEQRDVSATDRGSSPADRDGSSAGRGMRGRTDERPASSSGGRASVPSGSAASGAPGGTHNPAPPPSCGGAPSVQDQSSSSCLLASSTPSLGLLYPLSVNLNVDSSGRVGMGTTTPLYKLHVIDASNTGVFGQGGTTGIRGDANLAGAGNRYGGYFTASGGSNNIGVYGQADIAVYGVSTSNAVLGITNNAAGIPVQGTANSASGATVAVQGDVLSTSGVGVRGHATASSGATIGVSGETSSTTGLGVKGKSSATSGANYGVWGETSSSTGLGVAGVNNSTTSGVAVSGKSFGTTGIGVQGFTTTTGATDAPIGVHGLTLAPKGVGVLGQTSSTSASAAGVKGTSVSQDAAGVRGENAHAYTESTANFAAGVLGTANGGLGVIGLTKRSSPAEDGTSGVVGSFNAGGYATLLLNSGMSGSTDEVTGVGVYGTNSAGGVGVLGENATTASTDSGVKGTAAGDRAAGVHGDNSFPYNSVSPQGNAVGVLGTASGGVGVLGSSYRSSPSMEGMPGVVGYFDGGTGLGGFDFDSGVTGSTDVAGSAGVYGVNVGNGPGVWGRDGGGAGAGIGVLGEALSTTGVGVKGSTSALGASDAPIGVLGITSAKLGTGVRGKVMHANASDTIAVEGVSEPQPYYGIGGSFRGGYYGVEGRATLSGSGTRFGAYFQAAGGASNNYGVYSTATGTGAYAGYFVGNAHVNGTLSKTAGSFKIDHPLDPQHKTLSHSFVESPDMMNVYNGNVVLDGSGEIWVELPEWFEALNKDFRYQLTPLGAPATPWVAERVRGNRFKIAGTPGLEVSWQVTGIRKDAYAEAHRIPVEELKRPEEQGLYMTPEAFGQPPERGIDHVLHEGRAREREQAIEADRAHPPAAERENLTQPIRFEGRMPHAVQPSAEGGARQKSVKIGAVGHDQAPDPREKRD